MAAGAIVVAGVVAVALAAGGDDDQVAAVEIADTISVDGSLPTYENPARDPAVGRAAPTLAGEGFDGEPVEVTADGNPRMLAFLAHYCPHCQAEVPRIVDLEQSGGTEGVAVTGITTGTDEAAPNYPPSAWLEREGWPYPVLVDTADQQAAAAYGLTAYPMLVFIDADGKVAARIEGEVTQSDLAVMFAALAAGEAIPIPGAGPASPG